MDVRPHHSPEELQEALSRGIILLPDEWLQTEEGWQPREGPQTLHQTFYLGIKNTYQLAKGLFTGDGVRKTIMQPVKGCELYQ